MFLVVMKREPPERPESLTQALGNREAGDMLWNLLLRCWTFEPIMRPKAEEVARVVSVVYLFINAFI